MSNWHITIQGSTDATQENSPVAATREHLARMADAGYVTERAVFYDNETGAEEVIWPLPEGEEQQRTKLPDPVNTGSDDSTGASDSSGTATDPDASQSSAGTEPKPDQP